MKQLVHNGVGALIQISKRLSIRSNLSEITNKLPKSTVVEKYVSHLCRKELNLNVEVPFQVN